MQPLVAAEGLRKERIAVLIDLDGWIGDEPPRALMSSYPAPLRLQWLGWAGTIADPSISQIVTDVLVSPPVHLELYHERLLFLPRAYQLNDHAQLYMHILAPFPADGQPRTAPSQNVTIANFNQLMKLSPDIFSVWCGAMLRTPGMRLLLLTGVTGVHVAYPSAARNVRGEVAVRGVHIARLKHGGVMQKPMHLIRSAGCDLGVDTISYNSHTTGADMLWSGLPLVTQPGTAFSSRVATSLVTAAGAPNNRVASLKTYEDVVHLLTSSTETAPYQVGGSRRPERERSLRDTFGTFVLPWEAAWLDSGLRGPHPWDTQQVGV